jgi:hypothetical protein
MLVVTMWISDYRRIVFRVSFCRVTPSLHRSRGNYGVQNYTSPVRFFCHRRTPSFATATKFPVWQNNKQVKIRNEADRDEEFFQGEFPWRVSKTSFQDLFPKPVSKTRFANRLRRSSNVSVDDTDACRA